MCETLVCQYETPVCQVEDVLELGIDVIAQMLELLKRTNLKGQHLHNLKNRMSWESSNALVHKFVLQMVECLESLSIL